MYGLLPVTGIAGVSYIALGMLAVFLGTGSWLIREARPRILQLTCYLLLLVVAIVGALVTKHFASWEAVMVSMGTTGLAFIVIGWLLIQYDR